MHCLFYYRSPGWLVLRLFSQLSSGCRRESPSRLIVVESVPVMQIIVEFSGDPEDYVRQDAQLRVTRPQSCPNCGKIVGLRALGYYSRWVSSSNRSKTTSIMVRRFRCPSCHRTASMLPDFAQPYRLVATEIVDAFLGGQRSADAVNVWFSLLHGYQRRFESRLPETRQILYSAYGLTTLPPAAVELWGKIRRYFGGARKLTSRLAGEVGLTIFGVYQCHQPAGKPQVHTTQRFTCERSPPL